MKKFGKRLLAMSVSLALMASAALHVCALEARENDNPGAACEHSYGNCQVLKEVTCTQSGVERYTCTLCSETKDETIPALGHDWQLVYYGNADEAICGVVTICQDICARCGKEGYQRYAAYPHDYADGSCTRCDAKERADYDYRILEDGTCSIFYNKVHEDTELVPETLDGYAVTGLEFMCLAGRDISTIRVPATVNKIGESALIAEGAVVVFAGDAPRFHSSAFTWTTVTCYYPQDNPTWTQEVRADYSGTVTWKPYVPGDVTGDGKRNVGDVASVYAAAKGTGTLEGMALAVADVVADAKINIGDAAKLYSQTKI